MEDHVDRVTYRSVDSVAEFQGVQKWVVCQYEVLKGLHHHCQGDVFVVIHFFGLCFFDGGDLEAGWYN